jgi:hypothetical protein
MVENGSERREEQEADMGRVISDITMSLDGFIAGPNAGV